MFGRSGQMFPRRAYHDAIYEEEYGSESEEDCCRGRGLSAILCWFLSVIVLIGLAASVVLTVFFILKSRSMLVKNEHEDLNFVFDHGNGFKVVPSTVSTTVDLSFNSTTSPHDNDSEEGGHWMHTKSYVEATARAITKTTTMMSSSSTTRLPPTTTATTRYTTRKYYSDTTGDPYGYRTTPLPPTSQSSSVFNFLFNTIKTFQGNERERQYSESIEQPPIEEIADNNSDEELAPIPPMSPTPTQFHSSSSSAASSTTSDETTTPPPMTTSSPVLFTLPPSTSTMSHSSSSGFTSSSSSSSRKYPTRPPERTSFTSSEEVSASTYKHYDYRKPYMSPPRRTSSEETTTTAETTSLPSVESSVSNESYQADESKKLSSMLADQIPPHDHDDFDSHEYTATTVAPSSSSAQTEDTLAKLIRYNQPKWNKTTTTTTPRTRHRYIEIRHHKDKISHSKENHSGERYKSQRPVTTLPPTTVYIVTPEKPTTSLLPTTSNESDQSEVKSSGRKVPSSSNNSSPVEIVRGPDFKAGNNNKDDRQSEESNSNEYLDILVGSDDHQKTLVTKKTESGSIITSAILPPWFDQSQNSTDSLELTNDTLRFTTEKVVKPSDDDSDIPNDKTKSDLDALFDLFSPSSIKEDENKSLADKRKDAKPKSETYISDVAPEESKAIHLKKLEDELKPFFSSPSEPADKPPPSSVTKPNNNLLPPSNTGYHYGPSGGKTHIFGYYPEDEPLDDGPPVNHRVDIEIDDRSENLVQQQQQNRRNGSAEMIYEDEPETSDASDGQSPVIDIAYDPKVDPEIVIEPEAGELDDDEYNDDNVSELIHEPMAAGSDAHSSQVYVPPPANMINNNVKPGNNGAVDPHDGSGIRRPTKNDRKYGDSQQTQEQVERPGKVDWSSKERPAIKPNDWSGKESNSNHNMAPPKRWTSKEIITSPSNSAEDEDEEPPNKDMQMEPEEFSDEDFLQGEEDAPQGQTYYANDNVLLNRNGTEAEATIEDSEFTADRKVERKPIVDVDASLYDIKDGNVATTTTPKPRVRVYEVYSKPYKPSAPGAEPPTERPASLTSEELSNQTGFVPPEPINFHENTYAIDEQSSSEYISRDGWRPVLYNRGKEEKLANGRKPQNNLLQQSQQKQQQSQSAPQFSSPVRASSFTAPQAVPITTPLHIPPTTPSDIGPSAAEYEDEMVSQENNWYPEQPQPNGASSSEPKMTIKPSRPIPPMLLQPQPPRMRFPATGPNPPYRPPQQQPPPYPPHNIREGQQVPHPLNPQQNPQSPPHAQIHHHGPQQQEQQHQQSLHQQQNQQIQHQQQNQQIQHQQQNQQIQHQQQNQQIQHQQQNQPMQHQQQNQPMQHQQQNQQMQHQPQAQASSPQNSVVDRSKYSQRPVRPPIVMRRKPPFPFSPGNRKRITKVRINGPPRSPPRGPPYSPPPQQLPSSPEQYHSQQQQQHDNKSNQQQVIRQRHDPPFQQQPLPPPPPHSHPGNNNMMPHGTVHWPPDDMFLRRQQPPMINRRPSG